MTKCVHFFFVLATPPVAKPISAYGLTTGKAGCNKALVHRITNYGALKQEILETLNTISETQLKVYTEKDATIDNVRFSQVHCSTFECNPNGYTRQGWIQPVSLGGAISVIFGSQVSFRIVKNHGEKSYFRKF